ncbi:tail fiber domain-containing protein [bacterium]|nr:tail fiber domain-containing protein [bacterium]
MARSKSRNIADLVQGRGNLTLNSNNISAHFTDIDFLGTGSITLPTGTTAQRDGSPAVGMIRFNTTLGVFEGYRAGAWAEIGGGSSDTWTTDNFTGNGSTAAYTLTQAPSSEDNVIAFIEGVFQNPADFAVVGTTITFDENIPNGQKVVVHSVKATVAGTGLNQDAFTGDASTTAFTLSINPINENNTMVYIDGVYQNKSTYSTSGTTLTFSTAPDASAAIEVLTFTQTTINAPTSNSVSTTSLIDDSVTNAKLAHGLTLQGNTAIVGNLDFADSYRLHLGSDDDFAFFHTGGNAVIHNTTGELRIRSNTIKLQDYTNEDLMIVANSNDSVELYYNNIKKFETSSTGVTANGTVTATAVSATTLTGNLLATTANATTMTATTFSGDLNGTINTATSATTQANTVANTTVATTAYVSNKIAEVIGGAPGTLDTLNELAAAINDDDDYNTTLTTALATKLPLAGGALTGALTSNSNIQMLGNLDVKGQIGAYDNPSSAWGKMILRATDFEFKNSGGTIVGSIDTSSHFRITNDLQMDSTSPRIDYDNGDSNGSLRLFSGSRNAQSHQFFPNGHAHFNTTAGTLEIEGLGGASNQIEGSGSLKIKAAGGAVDLLHGTTEVLNTVSTGIQVPRIGVGASVSSTYKIVTDGEMQSQGFYNYGWTTLGRNTDGIAGDITTLCGTGLAHSDGNRYGNYGQLRFNSTANWTSSARQFLLTNGYDQNKFAIIKSDSATNQPDIHTALNGAITNGSVMMVLDPVNDRVGINEPNPLQALHVNSGATNVTAKFQSTDGTAGIILQDSGGNVELQTTGGNFEINPGGTGIKQTFHPSGHMHIGHDVASVNLYVGNQGGLMGGNASHNMRGAGNLFMFNAGGTNGNYIFECNGTSRMTISNEGINQINTNKSGDNYDLYVKSKNNADPGIAIQRDGQAGFGISVRTAATNYADFILSATGSPDYTPSSTGGSGDGVGAMRLFYDGTISMPYSAVWSSGVGHVFGKTGAHYMIRTSNSTGNESMIISNTIGSGGALGVLQYRNGGSVRGDYLIADNTNGIYFNSTSDYRFKENVTDIPDGYLNKLTSLRPVTYTHSADMDDDTTTVHSGLIAHEVAEVFPEFVLGDKDAVYTQSDLDAKGDQTTVTESVGDPLYQTVAYSKKEWNVYIIKALQELKAENEALKARIVTLEG